MVQYEFIQVFKISFVQIYFKIDWLVYLMKSLSQNVVEFHLICFLCQMFNFSGPFMQAL